MGKGQSKPLVNDQKPCLSWDQNLNQALRELFGISATGGVYLTGVDLITLPMAFVAGDVIGAGISVRRGDDHWAPSRAALGRFCAVSPSPCPHMCASLMHPGSSSRRWAVHGPPLLAAWSAWVAICSARHGATTLSSVPLWQPTANRRPAPRCPQNALGWVRRLSALACTSHLLAPSAWRSCMAAAE